MIRTTGLAIIGVIVSLQSLDAVGVNLAPLLASAGVAGIAIGLAAQNIVRDMLNGMLILIEDQFNVGDTVRLAGLAGTVEAMTLRKTTVRDADGTLYVIPNSQITTVANLSVGYSVATVNVSVDFSANPDRVLELLKGIAMEIREQRGVPGGFCGRPADSGRGCDQRFGADLSRWSSRRWRRNNTRRCGSSGAGCGWRWRSIICCPATQTGFSRHSPMRAPADLGSEPRNPRRQLIRRR